MVARRLLSHQLSAAPVSRAAIAARDGLGARHASMLDAAETLNGLRVPLHNRLESLRGDRIGEQRIRTNQR